MGQEVHLSDWLAITQQRIDAFADATSDHQWIHVDPARAAAESPWGTTIAHGYLTLSLYPMMRGLVVGETAIYPGVRQVINYGLDKLRFPNAVKVGSRIRVRCVLTAGRGRSRAACRPPNRPPSRSRARRSRLHRRPSCGSTCECWAHARRHRELHAHGYSCDMCTVTSQEEPT